MNPGPGEPPPEEDVRREVEAHLAMRAEELMAEGMAPEAARAEARRRFGNVDEVERAMAREARARERATRRARTIESFWQDLRYAARSLRSSPGFSLVAGLTLALGIGATTAVFSVVNGVLLKPLPYPEPEALVWVDEVRNDGGRMSVAWGNYEDWSREAGSLSALTAYGAGTNTVLGGESPIRASTARISDGFWHVFPVRPVEGRLTTPEDHVAGADPVVVVREDFWRTALGGRALETLRLDVAGVEARVVGVVPRSFRFPGDTEMWGPVELAAPGSDRTAHNFSLVGRLGRGTSPEVADAELDAILARVTEGQEPSDYLAVGAAVTPLHQHLTGDAESPLLLLLGAAGLVLLVACTNLASTMLARGMGRAGEFAVRASLGADRPRLLRQLVTEGGLLAAVGGAAGVGLAFLLLNVLRRAGPAAVPRLDGVAMDGRVLLFAVGATALTVLLFALVPALRVTATGPSSGLREAGRGGAGDRRGRTWQLLVGTEVALTLVLLVASGLLLRSFQAVMTTERGFSVDDVVTTPVSLSRVQYPRPEDHVRWLTGTAAELEALPAVEGVGVINQLPLKDGLATGRLELDGDLSKTTNAGYLTVDGGFFQALDVPLVRGRLFDERDHAEAAHVAVVSESFARENWPGEAAVGKQVSGGGMDGLWQERPFATVIGVVGDVRHRGLTREPVPTVYMPWTQRNTRIAWGGTLVVEAAAGFPASSLIPDLRRVLSRAEPDLPLRFQPMADIVAESVAERTFLMNLVAGFSLVGLLLSAVGIYGVVSWTVSRRTREMGIRLALGAEPGRVRAMVLRGALGMVAGGLVLGVAGALLAAELVESFLYGVPARDPLTVVVVTVVVTISAVAASWIPAARSTRVDPVRSLRAE